MRQMKMKYSKTRLLLSMSFITVLQCSCLLLLMLQMHTVVFISCDKNVTHSAFHLICQTDFATLFLDFVCLPFLYFSVFLIKL